MNKWYKSISFLAAAVSTNFLANHLIGKHFPDRPLIPDALFQFIPHIKFTEYLIDIIPAITVLVLIFEFAKHKDKVLNFINVAALFYFFRGVGTILNPLARPTGIDYHFGISMLHDLQLGMWPSGHIGFVIICLLLTEKHKNLMRVCALAQIFSLIASRGHYSIDVVGGILIAIIAMILVENNKVILDRI